MLNTSQHGKLHGGHATRGVFLSLNFMMFATLFVRGNVFTGVYGRSSTPQDSAGT
jgi:hypothetical protein